MKKNYSLLIYIGRFQPLHLGHLHTVEKALMLSDKVLILLGSHLSSPSVKNPWSSNERIFMMKEAFKEKGIDESRVSFSCIKDRLYSEDIWISDVKKSVAEIENDTDKIGIIGHEKDSSSYYLKIFPKWTFIETGNYKNLNSTNIRELYFQNKLEAHTLWTELPFVVQNQLKEEKLSEKFDRLSQYFFHFEKEKKSIPQALGKLVQIKIQSLFVTDEEFFVVTKQENPYSGYLTIPEIDLHPQEQIEIKSRKEILKWLEILAVEQSIIKHTTSHLFDYPGRVEGLREIVYSKRIKLHSHPKVDEKHGIWIKKTDLEKYQPSMFADHAQIVEFFSKQ